MTSQLVDVVELLLTASPQACHLDILDLNHRITLLLFFNCIDLLNMLADMLDVLVKLVELVLTVIPVAEIAVDDIGNLVALF